LATATYSCEKKHDPNEIMAFNLLRSLHCKCKRKDSEGGIGKNRGTGMREGNGHNPLKNNHFSGAAAEYISV